MLQIANLEVVYHSVALVLKGVSMTVPTGQVIALLGPNGAGKTTLLRAITGLLPIHEGRATKGTISFDATQAAASDAGSLNLLSTKADAIVRGGIAHVMEGRRIFADLTVEENLLAGAHTVDRRDIPERLDRYYTRFPVLGERRHKQAGYMSGGEQQMLAIARALMSRPKLLLLDEPSLGLAPRIVQDVANMIREIQAEGVSILLVEQNAGMALQLAQYGYLLENGRIVLDGSAEALLADEDVQEFYLGMGTDSQKSYRDVKLYKRRKRWLS